ncbi:hypothetical protein [Atribacter laminatus]|nr:hypothetical protein [Atribacter laminatus]
MTRLPYYNLTPDGNENSKFGIPWHVATLNEGRAQCIVPQQIFILL